MLRFLTVLKFARALQADRRGAVALYAAFSSALVLGGGVLAIDFGRLVVLRTQMQNAADSAALSAAAQLNGQPGAIARARSVAQQGVRNDTSISNAPGALSVQAVNFYSQVNPSRDPTSDDFDAAFVEVVLVPQQMTLLLKPALDLISTDADANRITELAASAVATFDPVVCNAPPFMVCDPTEGGSASDDFMDPANAGREFLVKESGGGSFAPGNYGLLCPTDSNCGSNAVGDAIAAENPQTCYGATVDTSPGAQTQQVRNGLNARFDTGNNNPRRPSRDIMPYPRDSNMTSSTRVANGNWNPTAYWSANHPADPAPADLSGYSRYQVYLYEMGAPFARNGKRTLYPAPNPAPAGYSLVTPPGPAIPPAGVPTSTTSTDVKRRVVKLAVLRCSALNVQGRGSYPTFGRFIEAFLTEPVSAPPNADIHGEIIGPLTSRTSSDFHANVRLVD
jgi:Flp pilus assembly protein TadG